MIWIARILLYIAAPIATLFVARDALNFGFIQTLIAVMLVVAMVAVAALWPCHRKSQRSTRAVGSQDP